MQFIYLFDPVCPEMVTDPNAWTEEDLKIGSDHFSYLQKVTEEGTVILAGRSLDGIGSAIVIIEVESEVAALNFMNNDPFVISGLMRAHLHPFRAALIRKPKD
jgi:uncharacterized protein YciI